MAVCAGSVALPSGSPKPSPNGASRSATAPVNPLLRADGVALRVNHESIPTVSSTDRNAQFELIANLKPRYAAKGSPLTHILSSVSTETTGCPDACSSRTLRWMRWNCGFSVRMLPSLQLLAARLQAVAEPVRQAVHAAPGRSQTLRAQPRGQLGGTESRPAERAHRITARNRIQLAVQGGQQFGIALDQPLATASRYAATNDGRAGLRRGGPCRLPGDAEYRAHRHPRRCSDPLLRNGRRQQQPHIPALLVSVYVLLPFSGVESRTPSTRGDDRTAQVWTNRTGQNFWN